MMVRIQTYYGKRGLELQHKESNVLEREELDVMILY